VVLKGASGSGKTTLLTLLACLREIQGGSVDVLGNRLDGARAKRLVEVRRRLGFIFQSHNLHPALTAMQNVRMGLELHGRQAMGHWQQAASHMLTSLGLGERLDYLPAKLSGGQKQRVAIARALVGNPEIVFADEPTAALDAESGRRVVDILKELGRRRGTTSLVVTHDPRVLDCADRVITLDGGRIIDDQRRP
jgi:putative ABC transport system ATP-binding protein